MSLLGDRIKAVQSVVMEEHVPKVLDAFMKEAKNCGEYGGTLDDFTMFVYPDTSDELWESLCVITDTFGEKFLAEQVGIIVEYKQATEATVKWSRK